ncbi:MAG: fatty acid desaturase family protein [Sphingopyxis sp.]
MAAVAALKPTEMFSPEEWRAVTRVSPWRGVWLIAHGWLSVVAIIAGALWIGHWLAYIPALFLIGGRQLGLAILMHDAAHGLTHPKRRINNFAGEWLSGAAVGSDLQSYRAYHLTHHRYTQQAEDPDLGLSAPFPTSRNSLIRKFLRDLTGQTFAKQRVAQFAMAGRGLRAMLAGRGGEGGGKRDTTAGTPFNRQGAAGLNAPAPADDAGAIAVSKTVGRFLVVQAILLALSLTLWGWTPYLLWLIALATTFQLALRIRNIAEHACTATGPGDPFSHARTTIASLTERALLAPYWVNYHAEHHLFMGVPCYRLARVHRMLMVRDFAPRMTIADGYAQVLRQVVRAV